MIKFIKSFFYEKTHHSYGGYGGKSWTTTRFRTQRFINILLLAIIIITIIIL